MSNLILKRIAKDFDKYIPRELDEQDVKKWNSNTNIIPDAASGVFHDVSVSDEIVMCMLNIYVWKHL